MVCLIMAVAARVSCQAPRGIDFCGKKSASQSLDVVRGRCN
jgi:hypothetical protein